MGKGIRKINVNCGYKNKLINQLIFIVYYGLSSHGCYILKNTFQYVQNLHIFWKTWFLTAPRWFSPSKKWCPNLPRMWKSGVLILIPINTFAIVALISTNVIGWNETSIDGAPSTVSKTLIWRYGGFRVFYYRSGAADDGDCRGGGSRGGAVRSLFCVSCEDFWRQLVSLLKWRRALRVSSFHGLVWWIEKYVLIINYILCPVKGRLLLRLWEIHVTFLCPSYLPLVLRVTWLLSGLMRQITWLVLRIAKPVSMVGLFYLRGINISHTWI